MSSFSFISVSGMNAAQTALSASAFRIASAGTGVGPEVGPDRLRRQQVEPTSVAPDGAGGMPVRAQASMGVEVTDMVDLLQAKNAFLANLAVFKTSSGMAGTLLSIAG